MGSQSMADSKIIWVIKDHLKYYGPFASLMVASDWADASNLIQGPFEYVQVQKPVDRR